jgi:hypothetical protein
MSINAKKGTDEKRKLLRVGLDFWRRKTIRKLLLADSMVAAITASL